MSNIKLIGCDIDDTLIPRGKDDISDNLKMAFKQLKEKNIKLLVATGRHYKFLQPKLFDSLTFDHIVTINGAVLNDRDGKVLSYDTISLSTLNKIVDISKANNFGLGLKFKDNIVTYVNHKKFVDTYLKNQPELLPLVIDNCQSQNYHLEHGLPCGIFIIGEDEIVKQFNGRIDDLIIAKSYPNGYDAFLYNVNKATGIEKYLELNNLSWDDCMAFGDAQNDIFMLEKARISVTFSNSLDDVKQNCTYITDLCANDGVYKALKHFEII